MGIKGILWAAPLADLMGIIISLILIILFFRNLGNENVVESDNLVIKKSHPGVIITIAREHGSAGKYIGELVAKKLNIPYYYKEMTALAAKESGLDQEFIAKINDSKEILNDLYMSSSPVKYAILAQEKIIKKIATEGSCVIVGRAADYVLRDNDKLLRVFIYANKEYKIDKLYEMYGDDRKRAIKNMHKSDKNRASYYKIISGNTWGDYKNYDLMIDSSVGTEKTADIIVEYIKEVYYK